MSLLDFINNSVAPLNLTDSYKLNHEKMYKEGSEYIFCNITPRSDKYLNLPDLVKDGKYVAFGLEAFLEELHLLWEENFFSFNEKEIDEKIANFKSMYATFLPPDSQLPERFKALWVAHDRLPITFRYAPSGTLLDIKSPYMTLINTDPEFFWLPNFLETHISVDTWKRITIATIARGYRKILEDAAKKTGSPRDFIQFQAHDFSMRGMSNLADTYATSAGHLLYFTGTDTLTSVEYMKHLYPPKDPNTLIGASVPASEHSVSMSNILSYTDEEIGFDVEKLINDSILEEGIKDIRLLLAEIRFMNDLIKKYPSGILSYVADTYDYWSCLDSVAKILKPQIEARTPDAYGNAKLVFRPDSGNPIDIICGTKFDVKNKSGMTSEEKGSLEILWEIFGGSVNEKGYRVLNPRVGLIYGDSITPQRMCDILDRMEQMGFASCNVVFGCGSYTYNFNTRDSLGIAMKATHVVINDQDFQLFKDPKTDSGTKKSAKGMIVVTKDGMVDCLDRAEYENLLDKSVLLDYDNYMVQGSSLEEIRELALSEFN